MFKVRHFLQTERPFVVGMLVCFCALGLLPVGNAQTEQVSQLIRQLEDKDSDVRRNAAHALGEIKDPRAVEPLIAALKDANPDVRGNAAYALGLIKDPRAVEPLIAALKDPNPGVRRRAAYALGDMEDSRAVEPLTAAMKDSNPDVRQYAATALGKINDSRATETMSAHDTVSDVRQSATVASDGPRASVPSVPTSGIRAPETVMGTWKLTKLDTSDPRLPVPWALIFGAVGEDQVKVTEEVHMEPIMVTIYHVQTLNIEWIGKFDGKFYPYLHSTSKAPQGASYEEINSPEKHFRVYGQKLSGTILLVRPQAGYTLRDMPISPYYMAFDDKSCTVATKYYTAVYHKQ